MSITGNVIFPLSDLGSGAESVKLVETKTFVGKSALGTAKTELHTVSTSFHEIPCFKYEFVLYFLKQNAFHFILLEKLAIIKFIGALFFK